MGGFVSSALKERFEEQMKRTQEFQKATQRTMLERQLEMQMMMMEKQRAAQLALARDRFHWYTAFVGTVALFCTVGAVKKKQPGFLIPLVPLGFLDAYQWDMAYNNKMDRARDEAERILQNERHLVALPGGKPTVAQIDARRSV